MNSLAPQACTKSSIAESPTAQMALMVLNPKTELNSTDLSSHVAHTWLFIEVFVGCNQLLKILPSEWIKAVKNCFLKSPLVDG